ncbi:MAG: hypothetical protein L0Z50_32755, partial [Verrucomicrobiales bacterium]|nr:hypothetical protein [Verrucomicrobiales bacterium]
VVRIVGVQGNTAANGTFLVSNISGNTFTLAPTPGNGTYTPVTGMDRVAMRVQQGLAKIDPTFSAPDVVTAGTLTTAADGGAASGLTLLGRYKYLVAFERDDGTRSLPSTLITHLGALSGAQNMITLTDVPVGTDPQIERRLIYRTVAGGDQFFLAGAIEGNIDQTLTDRLSDRELVKEPPLYPLSVVYAAESHRLLFERPLPQIQNVSPFLISESVSTLPGNSLTVTAGISNPAVWKALGASRSILVTYNGNTRTVTPDFSAVTNMTQVATAITSALNLAANFNGAFSNGTYESLTRRFTITSTDPNLNITAFGAAPTASLVQSGVAVADRTVAALDVAAGGIPSVVQNDHAFLVAGSVTPLPANRVTVVAGSSNHEAWKALGFSRSIFVTFNNVTRIVNPDFSAVPSMDQVAVAITNALNLPANFGPGAFNNGTYDPATQRFTFVSADPNRKITAFSDPGFALLVAGSATTLPANQVTVAAGSSNHEAWKALGSSRSLNVTFNNVTRTVIPDFSAVSNMDEVAVAITNALNLAANFGANAFSPGTYDPATQRFTFASTNPALNITAFDDPGFASSLFGLPGGYLVGNRPVRNANNQIEQQPSLMQAETYQRLHPGGQADLHFSFAADPANSDVFFIGGDVQNPAHAPHGLVFVESGVTEYVGRLFRVDSRQPASEQQMMVGHYASIPVNSARNSGAVPILTAPHADSRSFTFLKDGRLVETDDNGIFILSNPGGTGNEPRFWQSANGLIAVGEFGDIAYDPVNKIITGGLQDAGNQVQGASDSPFWQSISGGDGNTNLVSVLTGPPSQVIRYTLGNNPAGGVTRNIFDDTGKRTGSAVFGIKDGTGTSVLNASDAKFTGFSPVAGAVSPIEPQRLAIGLSGVYESVDHGQTWTAVTPGGATESIGTVTAIAYGARASNNALRPAARYVAAGEKVYVHESAAPANTYTESKPIPGETIVSLAVDPTNWRIAYAASAKNIAVTIDAGANWHRLTPSKGDNGTLPETTIDSLQLVARAKPDLVITDRAGRSVNVSLAGAVTLGDVQTRIQTQATKAGMNLADAFVNSRIQITDNSVGTVTNFKVDAAPGSRAAYGLGLAKKSANANQIDGDQFDGNPALVAGTALNTLTVGRIPATLLATGKEDLLLVGTSLGVYMTVDPVDKSVPANPIIRSQQNAVNRTTNAVVNDSGGGTITFTASTAGSSYFNQFLVRFVTGGAGNTATLDWNPTERSLTFTVDSAATATTVVNALTNHPVASQLFGAVASAGANLVGPALQFFAGGANAYPTFVKLGAEAPQPRAVARIMSGVASADVTFQAKAAGASLNGVEVRFVHDATIVGDSATVAWKPKEKLLEFKINQNVTRAATIKQVLSADNDAAQVFQAVLVTGTGIVTHDGSGTVSGGTARFFGGVEVGRNVPNAQVTDLDYSVPILVGGQEKGDALVAGTRGRGVWKISEVAVRPFQERPELVITGKTGGNNKIALSVDPQRDWILNIFLDDALHSSFELANLHRVVVLTSGDNNELKLDANIHLPGGVVFDGGGALTSRLIIIGDESDSLAGPVLFTNNRGNLKVTDSNGSLIVHFVNVGAHEERFNTDLMAQFRSGLTLLVRLADVDNAFGRRDAAFVGGSLPKAVRGLPPASLSPIGLPVSQQTVQLQQGLAAQGLSSEDLEGHASLVARFLAGGNGIDVNAVGRTITDLDSLRSALDALDDIVGNVILTQENGVVRFDVTVTGDFAGRGEIAIDSFNGLVTLRGEVLYSFDLTMHLVFGIDQFGFFIETEGVQGPEFTISNLNLLGTVTAKGRLGFIEVSLTDGSITVDEGVRFSVDLNDPSADPLTGEAPGRLRPHEFNLEALSDLFAFEITGNPLLDDLVFSGTFGVAAIIPGSTDPPLTIIDAGLNFFWADINDPFNVRVQAQDNSVTGLLLEKLLNLDLKTVVLGVLFPLDKLGDLILGIEALDTPLPLVNRSINDLLTTDESAGLGDVLKLHDAVAQYFADREAANLPPRLNHIVDLILAETSRKIRGLTISAALTSGSAGPELKFNILYEISPEVNVPFDLGPALNGLGLDVTASGAVNVQVNLDLDLIFGVELLGWVTSGSLGDAAFVELNNLDVELVVDINQINLDFSTSFLQTSIQNAVIGATFGANI